MTRIRARPCAGKCFVDSKAPREVRDRPWPFFLHFPVLRPCPGQSQLGGEESPRLQPAPLESRGSGGVQRARCPPRRTRAPGPVGGRRRTPGWEGRDTGLWCWWPRDTSAVPTGSPESGTALRSCPALAQGGLASTPCMGQTADVGLSRKG